MHRYLVQNLDWLQEQLGEYEDDYVLFDCPGRHCCTQHGGPQAQSLLILPTFTHHPGQIELYTHIPVMRQVVNQLQRWDFRLCGVFLLDSQFLVEPAKFFAGVMTALSSMVTLELSHINVLSKMDLLDKASRKEVEK